LRPLALGRQYAPASFFLALALMAVLAAPAPAVTGGAAAPPPPDEGATPNLTTPLPKAQLSPDGKVAIAPASAPPAVRKAIWAANRITNKPYRYGGGHARFNDSGYDCSGAISYALRGGRLLKRPLDSRSFASWGERGPGDWITVYTNPGHAYVVIAGLRFDTSGPGERGPRWRKGARSSSSYSARHPEGF
jgi:cell wall-associated NlpC family hydrolase